MSKYEELTEELAANNKKTDKVIAIIAAQDDRLNTSELMDYRYKYIKVLIDRKIVILDEFKRFADLVEDEMLIRDLYPCITTPPYEI